MEEYTGRKTMALTNSTFFWQHKSFFSRDYILIQDEIPVGELHQHGWWNKQAIAAWDTERWDFIRKGLFKRTVAVSHNTVPIGEYGENFWGNSGKLVLGDGSTFVLKRHSFWSNNVGWYTREARRATSTSGATLPTAMVTLASSSRTSSTPIGPGTRWRRPTTGTASTPTSPI
jgi:hypothetical protein